MQSEAIILLSGGLDSVYNLYKSHDQWGGKVMALSYNYGQKAWVKELEAAHFFCDLFGIQLMELDIKNIFLSDKSSLISTDQRVPKEDVDIESLTASQESASRVWVANRNGVFLNIAACVAEARGVSKIIPGFNAEEATTFPDNSVDYINKMNACFQLSTSNSVQIHCFSQELYKEEMYRELLERNAPLDRIWTCYEGGEWPCGSCESCQRFIRASQQG